MERASPAYLLDEQLESRSDSSIHSFWTQLVAVIHRLQPSLDGIMDVKKVIKKREKLLNNAAPKEQPPRKLSGKRTVHNNSGKKAWPHRRSKSLR